MILDARLIEMLIFKKHQQTQRFTQDSPVYPDVWLDYFEHRQELRTYRADLIFTPHVKSSAAELFQALVNLNGKGIAVHDILDWEIATNGETVVAKLTLEELVTIALPMTKWWQQYLFAKTDKNGNVAWLRQLIGALLYSGLYADDLENQPVDYWLSRFDAIYQDFFARLPMTNKAGPVTLWSVNRNRTATISIEKSVPATKADAGRRLFDIDGSNIAWVVMDSGIDARHSAFRKTDPATGKPFTGAMGAKNDPSSNRTRVTATYDFTNFRQVLTDTFNQSYRDRNKSVENIVVTSSTKTDEGMSQMEINRYLADIDHDLQYGRQLDWSVIAPLLRIPHNNSEYLPPQHPHGTHVAGILGANYKTANGTGSMIGMCPGIELYDIRVMGADGTAQEFNILAAILFVRWLNNQKDTLTVQGVNMSFSMTHDVASYACGQTPVCVACERLVAEGTVVVTVAGNQGQSYFQGLDGNLAQGFRMVNITDPGNAEKVITVGATHRNQPHAYGVSYFSSKGPTGDGRVKPDLVAPGEKIVSVSPDEGDARMDGTSMAAPHVSGAAALILAKHRELIGKPEAVKQILCRTATDLGREKYFQGCGMIDVLRAIQSV
jgi:subtilisin family serine protease